MRKLLIYLKDYKKESVLAPLFKMLEAIFELFVPLVMSAVIDVGIKNSDKPYIIRMCLVLVALGIIGLACSITHSILPQRLPAVLPQSCVIRFSIISSRFPSRKWTQSEHQHLSHE